jgi:hypothetical protein
MVPQFIICSPDYHERSSGIRALHRLCHLLNRSGYRAMMRIPKTATAVNPEWDTPLFRDWPAPAESVVVYPEIVSGNPLQAQKVVRWALNYPGTLRGETAYDRDEMVFAWDARMLPRVSRAAGVTLDASRVLAVPVIDPQHIYPDASVAKDVDAYLVYKGASVREQFTLPLEREMICIDDTVANLRELGALLRRTRTLYSYDHATILFHEALICGCELIQVHADGRMNDPRECDLQQFACSEITTTTWPPDVTASYAGDWLDLEPARRFARTVAQRFSLAP